MLAAIGQSLSIGSMFIYTFGIFAKPLAAEFNGSRASISLAILLLNAVVAVTSPFTGYAVDRFGGRRVITISILTLSGCLLALSTVKPPLWHLYALYIGAGLAGTGSSPVAYSRVVANWFDRDRGLALGCASAGLGVGAFMVPSITQFVIQHGGWRQAYVALACLSACIAAPVIGWFLRGTPQELGLLPDGADAASHRLIAKAPLPGLTFGEAVRTGIFWQLFLIFYAVSACLNGTMTHLAPLLTDRGVGGQQAAAAVSLFGAATVIGRIGNGYLADKFFAPVHSRGHLQRSNGRSRLTLAWRNRWLGLSRIAVDGACDWSRSRRNAISGEPLFRDALHGSTIRLHLLGVYTRRRFRPVLTWRGLRPDRFLSCASGICSSGHGACYRGDAVSGKVSLSAKVRRISRYGFAGIDLFWSRTTYNSRDATEARRGIPKRKTALVDRSLPGRSFLGTASRPADRIIAAPDR